MDVMTFVGGIALALVCAALDSSVVRGAKKPTNQPSTNLKMDHIMSNHKTFEINFEDGGQALAIKTNAETPMDDIVSALGLQTPAPCIFISGGAGGMSDDDIEKTRVIMDEGIAKFAAQHGITVIDGGTESGVMQMIGEARRNHHYSFPLIGVAPESKVQYPGSNNENSEAELDANHSHFVLVDTDEWGGESQTIIDLTRRICGMKQKHALGILINGGKIAQQDIYLATAQGDQRIPVLVLEGSGRFAEELATAFRTGYANQRILQAIIAGGDIKLLATGEGVETMWEKLEDHFSSPL